MFLLSQHTREIFKMRKVVSLFYLCFIEREEKEKNCSLFLSPPTVRRFSLPPKLVEDPPLQHKKASTKTAVFLQMAHESYKMTTPRSSFDRHTLQQSKFEEKPGATVQADNV